MYPGLNIERAQDQARMAIHRAIEIVGNRSLFTDKLNELLVGAGQKTVTRQAIQWWESEGTFLHEQHWKHVESLTDYRVTRVHLRPDIYGIDGWRIDLPMVQ